MTARGEEGGGLGRVAFGAVGGAMADVVPRLVTYPLETLKSRSMVTPVLNKQVLSKDPAQLPKPRLAWRETLSRTYQTLGLWRGFFPGVHVALLGTIPGSAAYFFGYEVGKMATAGQSPAVQGAVSGVAAQLIANVFHTPIDNVKERAQVQESVVRAGGQKRVYSTSELVRRVAREEGLGAFMRGYWRGNLLWMPWSVLYVSGYEHLKRSTAEGVWTPFEDSEDSRTLRLGACSAASSAAACVLTHPIDVLKTRMQALPAGLVPGNGLGLATEVRRLLRAEGVSGLFAGLPFRVAQLSPATVMTWMIYEKLAERFAG